jgi:hypothetical protein
MFGYTKREIVGKSLSVIVPEPMGSQHDAYMRAYYWVSFGDYGRCSQPCAPPSTTASLGVASRPSSVCWSRALSTSNPDWQCLALSLPAPADVIPCNRFPCPKPFNWAVR